MSYLNLSFSFVIVSFHQKEVRDALFFCPFLISLYIVYMYSYMHAYIGSPEYCT